MIFKYIIWSFVFTGTAGASNAQKVYDIVRDFHAIADNRTDCYAAFKKAAETISKAGGGTLNIPKGKYYIGQYKINGGKDANGITNIFFEGCTGLLIRGNGSTIRVKGNFVRTNDYALPNIPYRYSYRESVCPFFIRHCRNVVIKDLLLEGGVSDMTKENVVEGECHGISIDDFPRAETRSDNILIQDVRAEYFAGDGIYIRCHGENISILNSVFSHNGRQGLSIVCGKNFRIADCTFDSIGYTGQYGWHLPGAGIDVENEFDAGSLKNVKIVRCNFRGSKGFQIVTTLKSENVLIDSCFISDETHGFAGGLNGVGMYSLNSTLSNSIIFGTLQVDIADQGYRGPVVQQFRKNIIYSGNRAVVSSDFKRPCIISDNIIVMLPNALRDEYFPYIQNENAVFNNNVVMMQASKIVNQRNALSGLVQQTLQTKDNFWLMTAYPAAHREGAWYYRVAFNNAKAAGKQYFPAYSRLIPGTGQSGQVPTAVLQKILSYSLFTAFTQSVFNSKYLVEADRLRKDLAVFLKTQQ